MEVLTESLDIPEPHDALLDVFEIDVGAPVLRMWISEGVLMVTTTRGTFPVDTDKPSQ